MGWFATATRRLDGLGIWWTGIGVVTGLLSWIWAKVSFLGTIRWPEAILMGLASALIVLLVVAGSLALFRVFRPLPQADPQPLLSPEQTSAAVEASEQTGSHWRLYAGWPTLFANELQNENRLILTILGYNGNDYPIRVGHVGGVSRYSGNTEDGQMKQKGDLPTPSFLPNRKPQILKPESEFLLVMHQHLSKRQADDIIDILAKGVITLDIWDLTIEMERVDQPKDRFCLPISMSPTLSIAKGGEPISNNAQRIMVPLIGRG